MTRDTALAAMRRGSLDGILGTGTSLYGVPIDTMDRDELLVVLGWSLSQNARLMDRSHIGVLKQ